LTGYSQYPAENQNGLSRDADPVPGNLAQELSTSAADLPGAQDRLAEPFRPVGGQGALGRTGYRVLGNSLGRREEPQHVIDVAVPAGADTARLLVPEMTYDGMEIGDEAMASEA